MIDADAIAREVVEPGTPTLGQARRALRARDPAAGRVARPARARGGRVRRRRDPQGARGDHASGDRRGVPAPGRGGAARIGRRPRRAAARGVEAGVRVRGRDRGGGAARDSASTGSRRGACPRDDAAAPDRAAGHRRGPPQGRHLGRRQRRRPRRSWRQQIAEIWPDLERRSRGAAGADRDGRFGDVTVSPHRYARAVPEFELVTDSRARRRPAGGDRRARPRASRTATASRRCSASPARARASRSPT